MNYNFHTFKERAQAVENWLSEELSLLRTGKAIPQVLDKVLVEAYGQKSELTHVGSIAVHDARTLYITPWDSSLIGAIQKGIDGANIGVSVVVEGGGVRVIFPELTGERRAQLVKLVGQKLEDARISLRAEREKVLGDMSMKEEDKELSEDERFRAKEELQRLINEGNARLETLAEKKRAEMKTL